MSSLAAWVVEQQSLPSALREFEARQDAVIERADPTLLVLYFGLAVTVIAIYLVSLVGLWRFKA